MVIFSGMIVGISLTLLLGGIAFAIYKIVSKIKIRRKQIAEGTRKKLTFKEWWAIHKPTKRRLIQIYAALLFNINIKGFFTGQIYRGGTKVLCVPGLNCYSCPGAIAACPLGALQNALAASNKRVPYYIFGIILLYAILFGRVICGYLCPVGLGQELLYKIKSPKVGKSRVTYVLSYFKYVILAVCVIAIPVIFSYSEVTIPAFCKYLCPGGTFGGAIWLLAHPDNAAMFEMLGWLFVLKFCFLVVFVTASVFIYRFFCRFFCPLGALYGLFNKFAPLGIKLDKSKCVHCGKCTAKCKMDIRHVGDHECINCGECVECCPTNAIKCRGFWYSDVKGERAKAPVPVAATAAASATVQPAEAGEVRAISLGSANSENVRSESEKESPSSPVEQTKPKKDKKSLWYKIAAWTVALVVLLGAGVYYNFLDVEAGEQQVILAAGDECVDFTLDTYACNGKTVWGIDKFTLSEFKGKFVVLNFWYTTCGPCVTEMPEIAAVADKFPDVVFVAIHSASMVTESVQDFISRKEWTTSNIVFAQDSANGGAEASDTFDKFNKTPDYPMTVIIDPDGVIEWVRKGVIVREDRNLLSERLTEYIDSFKS